MENAFFVELGWYWAIANVFGSERSFPWYSFLMKHLERTQNKKVRTKCCSKKVELMVEWTVDLTYVGFGKCKKRNVNDMLFQWITLATTSDEEKR